MGENHKSPVERLKKWAAFGYGVEASTVLTQAADLIKQQATRIANLADRIAANGVRPEGW
ncbi:hypothetical protein BZM27_23270 [Paraburkholderia steynii]|uniref:Uncharacterized protein n=1 Tax=Paraburkholderia steynii TaxID=1245441 RepID=A0A4R0XKN8_9BURK|nr:hypothetical protein BZM27_23270 [Paraburkholderia steynii]